MKNKFIKTGFVQDFKSDGSLDVTTYVKEVMSSEGYPTSNCCGGKALKDRDFADDAEALAGGVGLYELYHTAGVIKIRLV